MSFASTVRHVLYRCYFFWLVAAMQRQDGQGSVAVYEVGKGECLVRDAPRQMCVFWSQVGIRIGMHQRDPHQ